jgi:oligopeptide/dipeptide ABC transporter ATP-binding protein
VSDDNVLEISGLNVEFATERGRVRALRDIDLTVPRGSIVGVVGESGCGKSTMINSIIGLLAHNAAVTSGSILFEGTDLLLKSERELRDIRGTRISMVFQDPMTALNPVLSIGTQMIDIQYRDPLGKAQKKQRSIEMLIADEPTTALDATLEVQIIHRLKDLQHSMGCSILFISHHLGVIAELCDYVVVMYGGEVIERGTVRDIFHRPSHPYTFKLLECDPARIAETTRSLPTIPGDIPDLAELPQGCIFSDRCNRCIEVCRTEEPTSIQFADHHWARCHLAGDQSSA